MASVSVRSVHKSFDDLAVIHGVSIDINDGEFLVLVGPSGCGKSTLLRMIAGLEDINDGEIAIGDTVVNDMAPKARERRHGVPELRPLPAHDGAPEHGLQPAPAPGRQEHDPRTGGQRRPDPGADAAPQPAAAPALGRRAPARRHGPRHRARPAGVPSSTSRSPTSMPSSACRCGPRSRRCTSGSGPPRSTSPTTRSRR